MDLLLRGLLKGIEKASSKERYNENFSVKGIQRPVVGEAGIEPATRAFSALCYYLLSYPPIYKTHKEKILGVEPSTFCLTDKCSTNELNFF